MTKLGKMINAETLLQKNIERLPRSKSFIEDEVESIEEFQKRRIKWATEELERANWSYSKWDMLRKAGLIVPKEDK